MPPSDATLPPQKPRGFYTDKEYKKWSKDTTTEYFQGAANRLYWPLAKSAVGLILFLVVYTASGCWWLALGILMTATLSYQRIVAMMVPNTIAMPAMDQMTFLSNPQANVHYMNNTHFDQPGVGVEDLRLEELCRMHPKMRYKIKQIMGDYYYEEMSVEEVMEKAILKPDPEKLLRNQDDIDQYVRDNMNKKIPLDGPLYRVYLQDIPEEVTMDQPPEMRAHSTALFKTHHCFGDGVSFSSMFLAMTDEFSPDYFLNTRKVPWWYRLITRLTFIFNLPTILNSTFLTHQDVNFLTKRKLAKPLSGEINANCSSMIPLADVKSTSKKLKITINDLILSALMTSLGTLAKEVGDKSMECQIAIPANLRFKFYSSKEDVKMENKFTVIPITAPFVQDMPTSYPAIQAATRRLKKGGLGMVYSFYATVFWSSQLGPRPAVLHGLESTSKKWSIGFSNTPGPIKRFKFRNKRTGKESHAVGSSTYLMVAGDLGIAFGAVSSPGSVKLTLQSDCTILSEFENKRLLDMVYTNITREIERVREIPEGKKDQ